MPEFWTDCPARWFNRLESQFCLANITRSSTKFDHTVAYLPVQVSMSVAHILDNVDPAAPDSYDRLKAALCKGFTRLRWELAFELHSSPGLGDRKPTELMRHLTTLIPEDDTAGTWFMALFLMRLPVDMRDNIVAKDFTDCQEMAEYADKIHSGRKSKAVATVADTPAINAVAFSAIRHFRFLLEGRRFSLLTDHKPLVSALFRTSPPWSGRQQRQLSLIAEFTSDIRHTPGAENVVADALSRPPPPPTSPAALDDAYPHTDDKWPDEAFSGSHPATAFQIPTCTVEDGLPPPVDYAALAHLQATCPEVAAMRRSDRLQVVSQAVGSTQLFGEKSTQLLSEGSTQLRRQLYRDISPSGAASATGEHS